AELALLAFEAITVARSAPGNRPAVHAHLGLRQGEQMGQPLGVGLEIAPGGKGGETDGGGHDTDDHDHHHHFDEGETSVQDERAGPRPYCAHEPMSASAFSPPGLPSAPKVKI